MNEMRSEFANFATRAARPVFLSTVLFVAAGAASRAVAQPAPQTVQLATTAFQDGKKLFEQKKFPQALEKFRQSYDLVNSPNSHIFIARCQLGMGNGKDAFRTFQAVVTEADARSKAEPKYNQTRDSARSELNELSATIGVVTLNVHATDPGAKVTMNGTPVGREDWGKDIPVDPGPADVVLDIPGQPVSTQHITVVKGQRLAIDVSPAAPTVVVPPTLPPEHHAHGKPPFLPVGIAFAAVGVVGMAMFAAGGALSTSDFNTLKTNCPTGRCTDTTNNSIISRGKTEQLVGNVGLGIGCVGLAASVPFFILAATSKGKSDEHADVDPDGPSVSVDLSPAYAGVHGAF
jgi:hypothetical protein